MYEVVGPTLTYWRDLVIVTGLILLMLARNSKNLLEKGNNWYENLSKKRRIQLVVLTVALTVITVVLGYIHAFMRLEFSDVPKAMTDAITIFLNGGNPYIGDKVIHIVDDKVIMGAYNYPPVDLIVYSVGFLLFHQFDPQYWLYWTNVVIMLGLIPILWYSFPSFPKPLLTSGFLIFSLIPLYDNAYLMFAFMTLIFAIHFRFRPSTTRDIIISILFALGALTKLYLAVIAFTYFLYEYRNQIKRWLLSLISIVATCTLLVFPFGVLEVFNATVLFQANVNNRAQFAQNVGGLMAISYWFGISWLGLILSAIIFFGTAVLLYKSKRLNNLDKMAITSLVGLFLLPSIVTAFLMFPLSIIIFSTLDKSHFTKKYRHIENIPYQSETPNTKFKKELPIFSIDTR